MQSPAGVEDGLFPGALKLGSGPYDLFEGSLAEVRISKGIARSSAWIRAKYAVESGEALKLSPEETWER